MKNDSMSRHCPIVYAMDRIGGKWKMPLIWLINQYPGVRYRQIRKAYAGITNTVLTRALQELEQDGLIRRTDFEEVPPRVEYHLTQKGKAIVPAILELTDWGWVQMEADGKRPLLAVIEDDR